MRLSLFGFLFLVLILPAQAHADEMALISGGEFQMGSMEGQPDERPAHKVHVDTFFIDRYLVTNADYARFLNIFGNRVEGGKHGWITLAHYPRTCARSKKRMVVLFPSRVTKTIR